MMRHYRLLLPCVVLLAGAPRASQAQTLDQRVARLEQQVQQLQQLHGLDSVRAAAPDTSLPAELRGNVNLRWGYPGGRGAILAKQHFVILHDNARRLPTWVTYHLTAANLQGTEVRTEDFRPDPTLPAGERSELVDYRNSGYDRGHMAPAADFTRDEAAMSETFLLSNMAPQRPNLNRRIWAQLEGQVRALVRSRCEIWIFTGALYLDSLEHSVAPTSYIGPDSVAVPTHFYKVILCQHPDGVRELFAFLMPNSLDPISGQPKDFLVTVDRVQRLSGLDFWAALPADEQARLEALLNNSWPVP